ncbi:MAG: hypothetical protein WCD24_03880 [Serratia inhibens]|uniref:hypothetical protein n=1 Tax=Serratia inhibens TaxID=2338073 RepID=UPI003C7BA260
MTKRFNPDFSLSISHELAYMRETPEGGYVAHGDYATLFSELELVKADRDAQQKRADALAVENAEMRETLTYIIDNSNMPEYHYEGMGCGLEDRGITDPYDAMYHGWECAIGRVYSDVIPDAIPETPATSSALAAIEARVWAEAKDLAKSMLATDSADHIDFLFDGKIKQLREGK